jgi:hypothetical protein
LADGFVIAANRITSEASLVDEFPIASEIYVPEEVRTQGFVRTEFAVDLVIAPEV